MECELEKIKIYCEIYGEGKPVLMIHGFYPDHRVMKGCMEPIFNKRHGYKRIYFDLPGMGKTKGEKWITNSDQMLDITLQFIEKIIPDKKFLVVGESYGGYLARGVIYKKSEFVEGVCFVCPVIFAEESRRELPKHITLIKDPELISNLNPSEAIDFENIAIVQNTRIWERYRDDFISGVNIADDKFLTKIQEEGYPFSFDVDQLIKQYIKPALFLLGRYDSIVGYRDAWKIIEKYPRATFAILDYAGHLLQIEQEKVFNLLVNEWLDRIEEFNL